MNCMRRPGIVPVQPGISKNQEKHLEFIRAPMEETTGNCSLKKEQASLLEKEWEELVWQYIQKIHKQFMLLSTIIFINQILPRKRKILHVMCCAILKK